MASAKPNHQGKNPNAEFYTAVAGSHPDKLFSQFNSSAQGIGEIEARKRLKIHGYNEPAKKEAASLLWQILSKFINPLIILLFVIVLFSVFFGEKISAIFVSGMIFISVFLDFIQEYRSNKAMEKLNALVRTKIVVIRDGKEREIDIKDLVPGDVVLLRAGDMIPADVRIISEKNLFVNQSSLTGESFPAEKTDKIVKADSITHLKNMAFMGSSVVSGVGSALIVRTGTQTQFGEIANSIAGAEQETSFDKGIKSYTMLMIHFIIVLVIAILFIITIIKHGPFKDALLFSLAVAVGLTPEMLPMIVTLNLSKGAVAMAKKKVIVKKLDAIQNFGAMDVLCTDKTGTLTMDKIMLEKHCDVEGKKNEEVLRQAYINSVHQTGLKNLLDRAILAHEHFAIDGYKKVDEIPFDFERKIMSVVVKHKGKNLLISKGAPEEIYKRCSYYTLKGKTHKIDKKVLAKLKKEYDKLSAEGFRTLAVASKLVKSKKTYSKADEEDLVLQGYMGFLDPPKPTTKKVLLGLAEQGITVKILTGDNELVTKKICSEVGLVVKGTLTGEDVERMDDEELETAAEKHTIFARLSPLQKERVIRALQRKGHTVGYLGDGINDAPSLKAADVGISVDNAMDIAKESAHIILLEKSLFVLQDGVSEGRKTFGNITKYIKMSASSNFGNMLSVTGAALFLPFLPMLPLQILLNNFLYDLSQISLPADNVDKEYLKNPRPWNVEFIKKYMLFIGPISSLFDFLTFFIMWHVFGGSTLTPQAQMLFHTGWFLESLCSQTLVIYIIRTNKIPFIESRPNKLLLFTTLTILLCAFALPFTSFAVSFGFAPLPALYFFILAGMMVCYLTLVQIGKVLLIRKYGYQ